MKINKKIVGLVLVGSLGMSAFMGFQEGVIASSPYQSNLKVTSSGGNLYAYATARTDNNSSLDYISLNTHIYENSTIITKGQSGNYGYNVSSVSTSGYADYGWVTWDNKTKSLIKYTDNGSTFQVSLQVDGTGTASMD